MKEKIYILLAIMIGSAIIDGAAYYCSTHLPLEDNLKDKWYTEGALYLLGFLVLYATLILNNHLRFGQYFAAAILPIVYFWTLYEDSSAVVIKPVHGLLRYGIFLVTMYVAITAKKDTICKYKISMSSLSHIYDEQRKDLNIYLAGILVYSNPVGDKNQAADTFKQWQDWFKDNCPTLDRFKFEKVSENLERATVPFIDSTFKIEIVVSKHGESPLLDSVHVYVYLDDETIGIFAGPRERTLEHVGRMLKELTC